MACATTAARRKRRSATREANMASQGLRNLGRSGLRVSPLCLGAMNFGNEQFGCDEQTSIGVIHAYLDAGHNFIDTANVYSGTRSETIVGKAVKDRRDSVVIATKACEDSLRRLGTDYIDLYQMHRYDEATPLEETLSTLNDLVRQGKVCYIGVSNWTASQIVEACLVIDARGWEPLVSLQPQYSILSRDIEVEILPACNRFGLGVIPWSPLAGGMLTGKYKPGEEPQEGTRFAAPGPFQSVWRTRSLNEHNHAIVSVVLEEARQLNTSPIAVALAWNLSRPGVVAPIIGPKTEQQLKDNLAALDVDMPAEAIARIDAVSEPHLPYPQDFMRMARQLTAAMVQQNASPARA